MAAIQGGGTIPRRDVLTTCDLRTGGVRYTQAMEDSQYATTSWHGRLSLSYARVGDRTLLARRTHRGPLVVQSSLYPEGERVCQNIIVHPPAGIVGGDTLRLDIDVGEGARAQITTPGAAKWYRSSGAAARQDVASRVQAGSTLEWLPQETIVFDGAIAGASSPCRSRRRCDVRRLGCRLSWPYGSRRALRTGQPAPEPDGRARRRGSLRRAREPRRRRRAARLGGRLERRASLWHIHCCRQRRAGFVARRVSRDCGCRRRHRCDAAAGLCWSPGIAECRRSRRARTLCNCGARCAPSRSGRDAVLPRIWKT